jgi:hypothetical protein
VGRQEQVEELIVAEEVEEPVGQEGMLHQLQVE